MVPWIIGGAVAATGGLLYLLNNDKPKPKGGGGMVGSGSGGGGGVSPIVAPPGAPVPGLPSSGPGAPVGLTPPGVAQPPGSIISLPPVRNVGDALHDAAAALMQSLQASGVQPHTYVQPVASFQSTYNQTARTKLATDGKYGPKTQAALQSVVTPAVAPGVSSSFPVVQPANPAPSPNPAMVGDVGAAAAALVDVFSGGAKKGSIKEVSTFQASYNAHPGNSPLVVDGKYGGNSEVALQAVLNWSGGGTAPKNAYSPATKPVPTFNP